MWFIPNFLKRSFLSSCFPSLLHGSCSVRQWSKSEESSSLALWFPKKDLEKQVSWIKPSESFNINPCFSRINTWFFCPLWPLFSTDLWICPCSNTMLAVPPSSFSASFWFRYLSLRSEYGLISLSTARPWADFCFPLFLSTVKRHWECRLEYWCVYCCWSWQSVSLLTYRSVLHRWKCISQWFSLSIFSLCLKNFQIKLHWAYLCLTKPPFSSIQPAISFSYLLFLVWVTRGAQNNLSGDDYALTGHLLDVSILIFRVSFCSAEIQKSAVHQGSWLN